MSIAEFVIHSITLVIADTMRVRVAWSDDRPGYAVGLASPHDEPRIYEAASAADRPTTVGEINALPTEALDALALADEFFQGRPTPEGNAVRRRRAEDKAAIDRALEAAEEREHQQWLRLQSAKAARVDGTMSRYDIELLAESRDDRMMLQASSASTAFDYALRRGWITQGRYDDARARYGSRWNYCGD